MAPEPDLVHSHLLSILQYEPTTGYWFWLVKRRGTRGVGSRAGCKEKSRGYREIRIDGVSYREHRLAWFYMTGEWPGEGIDHINGVTDDNRWCNLREADKNQNGCNRGKNANNTTGYKGVCYHKDNKKWIAQIKIKGDKIHLGSYYTPEDAHKAYCAAAEKYHKDFART
jgi:hypothetical protein